MDVWRKILKGIMETGYSSARLTLKGVAVDSSDIAAKKGGAHRV
jgi:hypothetical protein